MGGCSLRRGKFWAGIAILAILSGVLVTPLPAFAGGNGAAAFPPCANPGWRPSGYGLKDHTVFWYNGYYYLASISVPDETHFAYARSMDLCTWEDLGPILASRTPGGWDEMVIWAPFVYQENGVYYMVYTGVTNQFTQSIMLATSEDPANPASWQPKGVIFQPSHTGAVWQSGSWADCRDPVLIKIGDIYYLYYTGLDDTGGIVGLATASSLSEEWRDWGAIDPPSLNAMQESPTLAQYQDAYYLFYHLTGEGEFFRIGPGPGGPWSQPYEFNPGWAHELWKNPDGTWFTSYLTDYSVTIAPLNWDGFYNPSRPAIGEKIYHQILPLIGFYAPD